MIKALSTPRRQNLSLYREQAPFRELQRVANAWFRENRDYREALNGQMLEALAIAERVSVPIPDELAKFEGQVRAFMVEPAARKDLLTLVASSVGALASGNEDPDFALEAVMELSLEAEYSLADVITARRWLLTPPGHDATRPGQFRAFRFKPSPAEWIELSDASRSFRELCLKAWDDRKQIQVHARQLLENRTEIEKRCSPASPERRCQILRQHRLAARAASRHRLPLTDHHDED